MLPPLMPDPVAWAVSSGTTYRDSDNLVQELLWPPELQIDEPSTKNLGASTRFAQRTASFLGRHSPDSRRQTGAPLRFNAEPMTTELRELHADEYATVCAWAVKENWPGTVKGELITQDGFLKVLTLPAHLSFALSEPGAPALGFGQIWLSPNGRANLVRIIVDPAMRGRGLGKRLCALLLAQALRLPDVTQVVLKVRRDNLPALAVYRQLGFKDIEAESHAHVLAMAYSR